MKHLSFLSLVLCSGLIGCTQPAPNQSTAQVNSVSPKEETINGRKVITFSTKDFTLSHVELDKNAWVVFKDNSPEPGDGGGRHDCLTCKVSNISSCADEVCPDVKKKTPGASCQNEIEACMAERCKDKCKGGFSSGGSGVFIP